MQKIFSFGELLLRISPEINRQWIHDSKTEIYLGGAELNVATALAKWNVATRYCTVLPENYLSKEVIEELKQKNIDTTSILISGKRIGIYFLPQGADLKHSDVIYDRANSSFSELKPGTINWDEVLIDCTWFHFSAISPALNENIALVCEEGLRAASAKGLTISVDLNYRAKLWQYGKAPVGVMSKLLPFCHVVMGNIWAAEKLLGISCDLENSEGKSRDELITAAQNSMKLLQLVYPKTTTVAYTFRLAQTYFSVLKLGEVITVSKEFSLQKTINKVGSGDCFMAGLIYGLLHHHQPQEIIDFASAAAAGKMLEQGDATNQTISSIKNNFTA